MSQKGSCDCRYSSSSARSWAVREGFFGLAESSEERDAGKEKVMRGKMVGGKGRVGVAGERVEVSQL
jgi:hypothetical protein